MMKKITLLCFALLPILGFAQTTHNITFQVDMNQYAGSFNAVEVFGTFNNFQGGVTIMTDGDNDGVYDVTVPIPVGTIEYLFAVDTGTFNYVVESMTPGDPCTITTGNFTNRAATVSADSTYAIVCWEACVDCGSVIPPSNITFQVDMSQYTGSYTDVNINGTFNGFCGSCATMTDTNNDDIYDITITVQSDTIEWLFTVDGFTDAESFNPGDPCTKTTIDGGNTFVNRVLAVTGDTTLPDVCWNSCVDCASVGVDENMWANELTISPNPTTGTFTLNGELKQTGLVEIQVTDLNGKVVYNSTLNTNYLFETITLDVESGIYLMSIKTAQGSSVEKIAVRK
jgi:hypothetical protein